MESADAAAAHLVAALADRDQATRAAMAVRDTVRMQSISIKGLKADLKQSQTTALKLEEQVLGLRPRFHPNITMMAASATPSAV